MAVALVILTWAIFSLAQPPESAAPSPWPETQVPKQVDVPKKARHYYDPAKLETLSGQVVEMKCLTPKRGRGTAQVVLQLKTDKETVAVFLGPDWYVEQQGFRLAAGDRLEISGSRVAHPKMTGLMAFEVRKGNQVLPLRNNKGVPAWRGLKTQ